MEYLKVMVFIHGKIKAPTKEILNKDLEMGMEYGKVILKITKHIKVITC